MTKKNAKKISSKINPLPVWLSDVMQGICYWVGHRRAYCRHHDLVEGAVVVENWQI